MKRIIYFLYYFLPPVLLMVAIFYMSSKQNLSVSQTYTVNFIFMKSVHLGIYALLNFLLFRFFYFLYGKNNTDKALFLSVFASIIYAISDEIHQSFVPTRTGTIRDIMIDTIGIVLCFQYTKNSLKKLKFLL